MHELSPDRLAAGSACALVMRGSATTPQYLLAAEGPAGVCLARWQRHVSRQAEAVRLPEHVLSYCIAGHAAGPLVIDGVAHVTDHHTRSAFWLPAGSMVQWSLQAPVQMDHLHLYLAAELLTDPPPAALPPDPWLDGFFALLAADHEQHAQHAKQGDAYRSTLLDDLLPPLLQHLRRLAATAPRPAGRVSALRPFILRRIEAHVQAHLGERVRLATLAALAGLSVDHFVRAFRLATGRTPHQYLLDQRLDRAAAALRETTAPVAEIARRCGFAGSAHFGAAFRRRRGMTPTAWRRADG